VSGEDLAAHLFEADESRGYSDLRCQVVRSVSQWSAGANSRESSIYLAYLTLIRSVLPSSLFLLLSAFILLFSSSLLPSFYLLRFFF
jgi:hypothetical protein